MTTATDEQQQSANTKSGSTSGAGAPEPSTPPMDDGFTAFQQGERADDNHDKGITLDDLTSKEESYFRWIAAGDRSTLCAPLSR